MKQYLAFPLGAGGAEVTVEVTEEDEGKVRVSRTPDAPTRAAMAFEAALEKIRPVVAAVVAKLQDVADNLSEMEVEFGISLNAKVGFFIVSGGSDVNFKVKLKFPKK
jgi:hypothetical protein